MKALFLSYNFRDEQFVQRVNYHLSRQATLTTKSWDRDKHLGDIPEKLARWLEESDVLVAFLGKELGKTQQREIFFFVELAKKHKGATDSDVPAVKVLLPGFDRVNTGLDPLLNCPEITVPGDGESAPMACAREIAKNVCEKASFCRYVRVWNGFLTLQT